MECCNLVSENMFEVEASRNHKEAFFQSPASWKVKWKNHALRLWGKLDVEAVVRSIVWKITRWVRLRFAPILLRNALASEIGVPGVPGVPMEMCCIQAGNHRRRVCAFRCVLCTCNLFAQMLEDCMSQYPSWEYTGNDTSAAFWWYL